MRSINCEHGEHRDAGSAPVVAVAQAVFYDDKFGGKEDRFFCLEHTEQLREYASKHLGLWLAEIIELAS